LLVNQKNRSASPTKIVLQYIAAIMKGVYNFLIALELLCALLYLVHIKFKPLGSDFMFGALIISSIASIVLFWLSFKREEIIGAQKIVGLTCASLPILWFLLMLYFLA
jgi:hypothetical protein